MKTYQQDYTAYQTYALLDFNISFEKDIPADDISRTVIEVTERIDINKFVDFTHRNSHGYDGLMMLRLLLLAFADNGYASTRKLAELCRTDIRYMFIAQNQKPSHQAFQRFIHDDLIMSVEEIFYEMNRIMEDELPIDTDILCIDGTKYEANANKNTFIWRKILSDIGKDSGRSVMILSRESISSLRNRISTADTPFLESLILIIY
ncbi:transposase [Catenibacterium mitsuokai]|uniref:transposase n=1 Tax=Catenibacterium mitsuokai TaxID=100886 RepID=UPI00220902CA|nr:transposase [Catenibacterium mitsuokai]UWO52867.1 transposase [Catenibacterium mitsuokai]